MYVRMCEVRFHVLIILPIPQMPPLPSSPPLPPLPPFLSPPKNWFCFVSPPPTRVALRQPYALPATATVTVTATVPVKVPARERQSFDELKLVSFHRHMFASHCLLFVTPPLICLLLYLGPVALGITSWQVTSNCPAWGAAPPIEYACSTPYPSRKRTQKFRRASALHVFF